MKRHYFAPYVPGEEEPWDPKATARHLLRRSGFGAPQADVERWADLDLPARVQELFDEAEDQEAQFQDTFQRINNSFVTFGELANLQAWWCYRMLQTRTPLREKLTLLWHGHFVSSAVKVDTVLLHRQIGKLRFHAWGNFPELVRAVCHDPAMLVYLDGQDNVRKNPNENFGRELLELFTLGKGNYTERDVRAAARAFTGWKFNGDQFVLNAEEHDNGVKEFLGRRGRWDGNDIVDILAQQPALPRFIAHKLLVFFACPEPPADVVAEAAEVFKEVALNIKPFLAMLFRSKFFYSPACRRRRIASPVEYVVGTCRQLGLRFPAHRVGEHLNQMEQSLYNPPSVKGWDGEKKWINSSTWMARLAFASEVGGLPGITEFEPAILVDRLVSPAMVNPGTVVATLAEQFLDRPLDAERHQAIARFLVTEEGKPQPEKFRTDAEFRKQQIRGAVEILLSLPEYHTV
jgi:uncharacterized protein (DUF1800 family)